MSETASLQELAAQILPCDTSKPYAFVSYSKKDYAKVYPCIIALQQSGCNIWVDKNMEEQADQSWTHLAFETIQSKNCVAIIFMISGNSLTSVPCFNEVLYSQKGRLPLNRHRNNPVKLITVNVDAEWNPRRTQFSHWVYDVSDRFNDDAVYSLSVSNRTLLEDLGEMLEPAKKLNIPTSGDVSTAFMNEVYGSAKEIDRTTVLPVESVGAIMKNISETMDKPTATQRFTPAPTPTPEPEPAPAPVPEPVPVPEEPAADIGEDFDPTVEPTPEPAYIPPTPVPEPEKPKMDKKVLIGIGAAVAAVLLLIMLFGGGGKDDDTGKSGSSSSVVAYTEVEGVPYELTLVTTNDQGEETTLKAAGTYTGKWYNDMPYEYGVWEGENGSHYEGGWLDGQRSGQGTYTWANGEVYTGEWKDNKANGQGTYTWTDGGVYTGWMKDHQRSGQGKMIYSDESVYEGEWADDFRNGKGTMKWTDGREYIGEWVNGQRSGQGKITYANGDTYEGEWADDKTNGQGTYTWTDGAVYVGGEKDNQRSGQGIMTYASGAVYEGEWSGDKRNGQGTYKWADNKNEYTGEWVDNQRSGQGTMTFDNGDTYVGSWENDKISGRGTYTFKASGNVFVGIYKDGKRNGQGTLTKPDGTLLQTGTWEDDKFVSGEGSSNDSEQKDPGNTDNAANLTVGNIRAYAKDATTAYVRWGNTIDGKKAKLYHVKLYKDSTRAEVSAEKDYENNSLTVTNTKVGNEYYLDIQAVLDDNGTEVLSEWTPFTFTFGGTDIAPPAVPRNIKAEPNGVNRFKATWDPAEGATGYEIRYYGDDVNRETVVNRFYRTKDMSGHINKGTVGQERKVYFSVRAIKTIDGFDTYSDWVNFDYTYTVEAES